MFAGYNFKNKDLYNLARTHTSYKNEHRHMQLSSNQRLEFLGDSVLSVVISEYIYKNYPNLAEGSLSKVRADVVCEASLYDLAVKIGLGDILLLGKGEEQSGGRMRPSTLADAFEAMIAAMYIDSGSDIETVRSVLTPLFTEKIDFAVNDHGNSDYKTTLQELVQRDRNSAVRYIITNSTGPEHDKTYTAQVLINNAPMGEGKGRNKKLAQQMAAKAAIEKYTKGK